MLHFNVAGANANTVSLISVVYHVSGSLTGSSPAGTGEIDSSLTFGFGNLVRNSRVDPNTANIPIISSEHASGWSNYAFTQDVAGGGYVFTGTYAITGATADLGVYEYLSCSGGAGSVRGVR